jgi:dienelactone hydrolase
MGTVILIIGFVAAAGFATFCIVTRSNQRRVASFVRLGAFAGFVLLNLVSIIKWSFRWYGLAILLLIWAGLGAWRLIGNRQEDEAHKAGSVVFRAIGTLLLVFVALIPALVFPQYQLPPMTGGHAVTTARYTYVDGNRPDMFTSDGQNREVNTEFWYPADGGGPYPLIVFSHGTSSLKTSNSSTFDDLASNGYVVCSIDHPYHSLFTVDAEGHRIFIDRSYLQQYIDVVNGKYDPATSYRLEHEWMDLRIADINFVLDTILGRVKDPDAGPVYRLIDPGKIGLMGHSLGGESSAQVARQRDDIGAVVNLDADMAGEYVEFVNGREVLNETPYPVPILNILADDLFRLIADIPDAKDIVAVEHVTATAPHAYEVHLTGTDHMSLTDLPLVSPFLVSVINASVPKAGGQEVDPYMTIQEMNQVILEFFNAFLKDEGAFSVAGMN